MRLDCGTLALVLAILATGCHPPTAGDAASPAPCAATAATTDHRGDAVSESQSPQLIVQITVDQLRGDMPRRMRGRDAGSGLDVLLARGVYFTNAHYDHANTETAVGHATLFTGATPAEHGMVANDWLDRETGKRVYNVGDSSERTLGEDGRSGVSPRNLRATTWGDELVLASGGATRVFSVSGKDRGAVIPAGRLGKAYWYSKRSGGFVSSTYHHDALPSWVTSYNALRRSDGYRGLSWTLRHEPRWYRFGAADDRPEENRSLPAFGRTFPHTYPVADDGLQAAIAASPALDELVVDFALTLLDAEGLGRGPATDVLAVSLSSTDYVGHLFGPASVEAEDNLARLGVTLSRLMGAVEARLGRDHVWVVLSSDHGGAEIPETLARKGLDAGRVDPTALVDDLSRELSRRYRTTASLVVDFIAPYLYLDERRIEALGVPLAEVEEVAARFLETKPGLERVYTAHELRRGEGGRDAVARRVRRSYFPARSGNLHVVERQNWLMYHAPGDQELSAGHGSPWAYDTHVPIVFVVPGVAPATVSRHVSPSSIAPTLTNLLGVRSPSAASRRVLPQLSRSD